MKLSDLTDQQVFDRAYLGILEQKAPGLNILQNGASSGCAYRNTLGHYCGIGFVMKGIVDEDSRIWKANEPIECLADVLASSKFGYFNNQKLVSDIQEAHDIISTIMGDEFLPRFKVAMAFIAKKYGLKIPNI